MDDDSGIGLLVVAAGVILVVYIIGLVLAAIVVTVAVLLLLGLALFVALAVGAGTNLGIRHGLGLFARVRQVEASPAAAQRGLGVIYGAPWLLLLCLTPLLLHPVGTLAWMAGLLVSVPAYYWTWWNGHYVPNRTALTEGQRDAIAIPEFHLTVSWPMDATMQAEEQILYARLLGRKLLTTYQAKVWMLEAKETLRERFRV